MTTTTEKNNLTTEEYIKLTDIILKSKKASEDTKQELYLYVLDGIRHHNFGGLDIKDLVNVITQKLNRLVIKEYDENRTSFIFTLYNNYCKDTVQPVISEELTREIEQFYFSRGATSNDMLLNKYKQQIIDMLFT